MIGVINPKDIEGALLITDIENKDCTDVIRKLREERIEFKMQEFLSRKKGKCISKMVSVSIAIVRDSSSFSVKFKPPILILDLLKSDHSTEKVILVGRKNIINALGLRPN